MIIERLSPINNYDNNRNKIAWQYCACLQDGGQLFPAKNPCKHPSKIEPRPQDQLASNQKTRQLRRNGKGGKSLALYFKKGKTSAGVACAGSCLTGSRPCRRRRPCRRLFLILPCWWMRAMAIKTYDIARLAPARCLEPHAEIGWFRTGRRHQAPGMPHGRLRIHVGVCVKLPCLFAR